MVKPKIKINYGDKGFPLDYTIDDKYFSLFNPNNSVSISIVIENLKELVYLINTESFRIDDYKKFLDFIKTQPFIKIDIANFIDAYDGGDEEYNRLKASVSLIYHKLECNKVYVHNEWRDVHYGFTISDRSRTFDYNVQNSKEDLYFSNQRDIFLIYDWVSADPWCMAILSEDDVLMQYIDDDLYNFIANEHNVDRPSAKRMFFRAVYRADADAIVLSPFDKLKKYIKKTVSDLNDGKEAYTILGKPIILDKRGIPSVFNRIVQNSTAHLMHGALCRFFNKNFNIITEHHDSIILSVFKSEVEKGKILNIASMFKKPLDNFPELKCKIYGGNKWAKWKEIIKV